MNAINFKIKEYIAVQNLIDTIFRFILFLIDLIINNLIMFNYKIYKLLFKINRSINKRFIKYMDNKYQVYHMPIIKSYMVHPRPKQPFSKVFLK